MSIGCTQISFERALRECLGVMLGLHKCGDLISNVHSCNRNTLELSSHVKTDMRFLASRHY